MFSIELIQKLLFYMAVSTELFVMILLLLRKMGVTMLNDCQCHSCVEVGWMAILTAHRGPKSVRVWNNIIEFLIKTETLGGRAFNFGHLSAQHDDRYTLGAEVTERGVDWRTLGLCKVHVSTRCRRCLESGFHRAVSWLVVNLSPVSLCGLYQG